LDLAILSIVEGNNSQVVSVRFCSGGMIMSALLVETGDCVIYTPDKPDIGSQVMAMFAGLVDSVREIKSEHSDGKTIRFVKKQKRRRKKVQKK